MTERNSHGLRWLSNGSGLGLTGGVVALLLPTTFYWLATNAPGGFFTLGPQLARYGSALVLAGSILFVLSLLCYRRSFFTLRPIDSRYTTAVAFTVLGTIGFLLIFVTALILISSSDSVQACLQSQAIPSFSCLQSNSPWALDLGVAGFWLGWLGGIGIVLGVSVSANHFRQPVFYGGAATYAILLLALVGPFVAVVQSFPGASELLLAAAALTLLAPAFVFAGTLSAKRPVAPR